MVLFARSGGVLVGVLAALVIRQRISGIPFQRVLVQGGPVISPAEKDATAIAGQLLENLKSDLPPDTVFVEIRNTGAPQAYPAVFTGQEFIWQDHLNSLLKMDTAEALFTGLKPSKQRQIRRGLENGAVIRPAGSAGDVEALYDLLKDLYRERVRKPLPPQSVFTGFYNTVQAEGSGVILVVAYRGKIIGGMVCAFSGRHTLHEWYVASERKSMKHLYPGVLSTWAGIAYAAGNGFSIFDFMGLGSPHQPYGTRDFKKQFGGETLNQGRWRYINNSFMYNIGVLGYRILKSLK